ncbi:MAG TPA: hypothetical protein VJN92_08200 [Candidatus Acidoferrum sp.]|nr:hypothetical protein [Candidatus Acidoferrum sp.]
MTAIWSNPEFLRNVRAQLRPARVVATACICAVLSIVIAYATSHQNDRQLATGPAGWAIQVLTIAFWLQALMLAVGGGIACINSIHREKEQNTFDYQRVTRMTPLELALGKLFGAPVFTYFVFLCLMPLALFGAVMGRRSALTVLAAYAVLLVASLAVHLLALLISLLTIRGSHTAAILVLLVILGSSVTNMTDTGGSSPFRVHPFGPFYAAQVVQSETWEPLPWDVDTFFGQEVAHVPLLLVIDIMFAAWFLLALVRNIKRDPNYYEIYSPLQAQGLALFLNLLFVAFYRWGRLTPIRSVDSYRFQHETPMSSEALLLMLNIVVFFCLGLATLRNRERVRRILRTRESGSPGLLDLTWPVPFMLAGTAAASLVVVAGVAWGHSGDPEWDLNFAVFRALFFVAWITRDMQFLQWMDLRRARHPLVMGALFLIIFYTCVMILMAPLGIFTRPDRTAFSAFFIPSGAFELDHSKWILRPAIWAAAFVAQWLLTALFIGLQKKTIGELNSPAAAPATAPLPAQT